MNFRQIIVLIILFILLAVFGSLPLWWDAMAPSIFGFPAFVVSEINAFIDAIKWLIDQIFN